MTANANPSDESRYTFEVPENMIVCFIWLLKKGPLWTADETPDIERLQAARHLCVCSLTSSLFWLVVVVGWLHCSLIGYTFCLANILQYTTYQARG